MRWGLFMAGLFLALAWGGPGLAQAQSGNVVPWTSGASFLNGIDPANHVYQPINTSNIVAPIPSLFSSRPVCHGFWRK